MNDETKKELKELVNIEPANNNNNLQGEIDEFEYIFDIDDTERELILTCLNNEIRPKDKQMKVVICLLSQKEKDFIIRYASRKAMNVKEEELKDEIFTQAILDKTFEMKIKSMENIYFKINGQTKEITNPVELYNMKSPIANTIVDEIRDFMNKTEEIKEKN